MPELPEVENVKIDLNKLIKEKILLDFIIIRRDLKYIISDDLKKLKFKTVKNVFRYGKYLFIDFSKQGIVINFGLTGTLKYINNEDISKYDFVEFVFSDNIRIRYSDIRKFGFIVFSDCYPNRNFFIKNVGYDPFSCFLNGKYLLDISRNKKTSIKSFIMNNKIVSGIGNIYANEILFHSKILPFRMVKSLNLSEFIKISIISKIILLKSIKLGGTSFKNFFNLYGYKGNYSNFLMVYGKNGNLCLRCKYNLILKSIINGRSTYFCCHCQF